MTILLCLLLLVITAFAQSPQLLLHGIITINGVPAPNVTLEVTFQGGSYPPIIIIIRTDSNGAYSVWSANLHLIDPIKYRFITIRVVNPPLFAMNTWQTIQNSSNSPRADIHMVTFPIINPELPVIFPND